MPDRPILKIMHAVLSIHPDASVEEAVQKMSSQGMEAILIKQEEEYTGIFTKIDLINLLEKILTLPRSTFPLLCQNPFYLLMHPLPRKKHEKEWWKKISGSTL